MSWETMNDDQRRQVILVANEHDVTAQELADQVDTTLWCLKHWAYKNGLRFTGRPDLRGKKYKNRGPRGPKNPALLEQIRKLANEGLSSNRIAAELRLPSRNIVIGLCSRNGIKLQGKSGGAGRPKGSGSLMNNRLPLLKRMHAAGAGDDLIAEVMGSDRKTVKRYREKIGLPINGQAPRPRDDKASHNEPEQAALFLDVIERARGRCRWIAGDPKETPPDELRCCGEPAPIGPWCLHHMVAAISPSAKEQEARTGRL